MQIQQNHIKCSIDDCRDRVWSSLIYDIKAWAKLTWFEDGLKVSVKYFLLNDGV